MITNAPEAFKQRLIDLFNNILKTSTIPHVWKRSNIICIPKPTKNKLEPESYRPISLISCTSKLLEKIIAKRIAWFLTQNNLIHVKQTGFKQNSSTTDALIHIEYFNNITITISSRNHCSIFSIDFEKAFDKIGIHTILGQLKEWNVGKISLTT